MVSDGDNVSIKSFFDPGNVVLFEISTPKKNIAKKNTIEIATNIFFDLFNLIFNNFDFHSSI